MSALQSDKKLAIIRHWSSHLHSGPIVHFINTQKPSSLQWGLKGRFCRKPSFPNLTFPVSCWHQRFSNCDVGGSDRYWGWVGVLTWYQRATCLWVCLRSQKQPESHLRMFQQYFSGAQRERERASACGGQDQWLGYQFLSVGIVWKLVQWRHQLLNETPLNNYFSFLLH